MLPAKEVLNTQEPLIYSEKYNKQDNDSAEPSKKNWNGRGIFKNEAPVTVFSREHQDTHFNENLMFFIMDESTSECSPKQQPAIRLDKGNPFIRFIGLKSEEAVDDAVSFLDWSKESELRQLNKVFHFESSFACIMPPFNHLPLEQCTLAEKVNALSHGTGSVIMNVNRHFHTRPISGNLNPHEDPPICEHEHLPDTGNGQLEQLMAHLQPATALSCDYLFTSVRKVDKESQTGHLCLYLAAKGLGNVNKNTKIISNPEITDDVNDLLELIHLRKPVALRLCEIKNKPGAGYAINQNTEYVFDTESAQKNSSGNTGLICRNKENPCQVLFRGEMSSSPENQSILTQFINEGHNNDLIVYKILHGFEISPASFLKPTFTRPTADDKEKPSIKRDILIGRLSVVPQEEELPEFYEKKSTEYRLGKKKLWAW